MNWSVEINIEYVVIQHPLYYIWEWKSDPDYKENFKLPLFV